MIVRLFISFFLTCSLLTPAPGSTAQKSFKQVLIMLDNQIEASTNDVQRARLYSFKARNYAQMGIPELARKNYIIALKTNYSGWLLNEYGYFLYQNGMYKLAYRAAQKTLNDFPHLTEEADLLRDKAYSELKEKHYLENPRTIIMNTPVDPYRVTRHDLINKKGR